MLSGWPMAACQQNLFTAVWKRMPTEAPKIVPNRHTVAFSPRFAMARTRSSSFSLVSA